MSQTAPPGPASPPDQHDQPGSPGSLDWPDRRIWLDGELIPWERATVHVLSHGLQRGSLIFDHMSVRATPRGPAVFRLADHVARFLRSAELVGLPLRLGAPAIEAAILETVRANPGANSVKISAYLASVEVDVVPMDDRVSLAIAAYDLIGDVIQRNPGQFHYRPQLRIWIEKERRSRRPDIIPPQAKAAANYVSPMIAKWAARKAGYDEILLVDEQGFVAEGPTTNLFLVDDAGALSTPPEEQVLLGVTRRSVLEIAKHDGIPVAESRVRPEELKQAAEVFLTGTTVGVWPVESVDDRRIGDGGPGPVTTRLRERFDQVASGQDPAFHHWLAVVGEPTGSGEGPSSRGEA